MPKQNKPVANGNVGTNIVRCGYTVATKGSENDTSEITMHGEVCRTRPVDPWTGKEVEGEFILESEILSDLKSLEGKKEIVMRVHSLGGECNTAIVIHNKLREMSTKGTKISCIVDGVAMSAGSYIMAAADNVKVSPCSLVMIHKSLGFLFGWYNADDLRHEACISDAYDKAIVAAYRRKTKKSDKELLKLMAEQKYMTGEEAVQLGFADELTEEGGANIAASGDRNTIFCNGRAIYVGAIKQAPEFLPTVATPNDTSDGDVITNSPNTLGGKNFQTGGNNLMANNLKELREENATLASAVEADVRAELEGNIAAEREEAVKKAVESERKRLAEIDEIAELYGSEMVAEAKYGEKPCNAAELALRAAKEAAKSGEKFMAGLKSDFASSGAKNVGAAPDVSANSSAKLDEAETRKRIDKEIDELFSDEEGG